ncbi:MAG: hypothetical protein GY904_27265 [Planctomycetaceae bacterium]|nr:hypothetical protein [Planctomycetaceae bacterium]
MNDDPNPYVPPQAESTPEGDSENRLKRMLLEAAHAFLTIFGIVLGWAVIGSGVVQDSTLRVVLGLAVIIATCCFGLLLKVKQKKSMAKE